MSRVKAPPLDVDRSVTVHRRAKQADIYEKALRRIVKDWGDWEPPQGWARIAADALKRAESLR